MMAKKTDLSGLAGSEFPVICKNYGEMCALLNEKIIKNGEKRRKQIDRWNRYLLITREGHKYIINEINENPVEELPKVNQRNTKYQSDGLLLLLDFIASEDKDKDSSLWLDSKTFVLYQKDGFQRIGFCNRNFSLSNSAKADQLVSNSQQNHFRMTGKNYMKSNLSSILNKGVKLGFIKNKEQKYFVKDINNNHRIATLEEVHFIELNKKIIVESMELTAKSELKKYAAKMYFYRELNRKLKEEYGLNYCYKNFILNMDMEKLSDKGVLLDDISRLNIRERINKNFLSSLKQNMLKRIEKNSQETADLTVDSEKNIAKSQFSINIQDINTETRYIYPPDHFEKWCWWLDEFIDATDDIEDEKELILLEAFDKAHHRDQHL
jgi:hypothetical protein